MNNCSIDYTQTYFLQSAADLTQLPPDQGAEVAFVGRSNAGKSSALNAITAHKQLARTSKTPGRTQLINVFCLSETCRLIDLPGYGYAKVSQKIKTTWEALLQSYLLERRCLRGLVLLMDCRHPLKETDRQMIRWATESHVPLHILLTKADKLTFGAAKSVLLDVKHALASYAATVQLFSATEGTGIEEARAQLENWFIQNLCQNKN